MVVTLTLTLFLRARSGQEIAELGRRASAAVCFEEVVLLGVFSLLACSASAALPVPPWLPWCALSPGRVDIIPWALCLTSCHAPLLSEGELRAMGGWVFGVTVCRASGGVCAVAGPPFSLHGGRSAASGMADPVRANTLP